TEYKRYRITENGISPRLLPGKSKAIITTDSDEHDEAGYITESASVRNEMVAKRKRKMLHLCEECLEPEFIGDPQFNVLLIGFGSTWGSIKEAVAILNTHSQKRYGALVFGDVYPLPTKELIRCSKQAEKIINIEQNSSGQLADLIRQETLINCDESVLKYDGRQISGDNIVEAIMKGVLK
ncbi:MAG: 2-oxoacid:acceptor oxidoreductase subunit alpha, partial [Eubacterium sp.]